jgi:nicotinamidase/pyrazinamidase
VRVIFWDVDTQVDFLRPIGRLYVPGAEQIVPNLARLTGWAREHAVALISSVCAHHPGDAEFAVYGPHCLVGSRGQRKIPETLLPRRLVVPNQPVELPDLGTFDQIILEKDRLDVFTNPNTGAVLGRYGENHDIVLYGVVTEICVAYAARGLLARGHHVLLVSDAVHHLNEDMAEALLGEIGAKGAEAVTTDDIVGPSKVKIPAA